MRIEFRSIITVLLFLIIPVASQAQWKFSNGKVSFSINHAGFAVDGNFGGMKAQVSFDPQHPELAVMQASIDVNTIETGIDLRNKHLKKREYFDVVKYPMIQMSVLKIYRADNQWTATCSLQIKGNTKTIEIPVQFEQTGKTATLKSKFKLDRLDYKVGSSSWTMSDEVRVEIVVNLI